MGGYTESYDLQTTQLGTLAGDIPFEKGITQPEEPYRDYLSYLFSRDSKYVAIPIRGSNEFTRPIQRFPVLTVEKKKPTPRELINAIKSAVQELTSSVPLQNEKKPNESYKLASELANRDDIPLIVRMNLFHQFGCRDFEKYLKGWNRFRYVVGMETCKPGEFRNASLIGYEYGEFASSAPSVIGEEMNLLADKLGEAIQQVKLMSQTEIAEVGDILRHQLRGSPFINDTHVLERYDDKELIVAMIASEMQRMVAHIHPWFERTGRTAEEIRVMISEICGVRPIVYSFQDNRKTKTGLERGLVEGILTYPILQEISRMTGILDPPNLAVKEVFKRIFKESNRPLYTNGIPNLIYDSKLRMVLGDCQHPDYETCITYYSALHSIMMSLLNSFEISQLIQDNHTMYHLGHLLARGTRLR